MARSKSLSESRNVFEEAAMQLDRLLDFDLPKGSLELLQDLQERLDSRDVRAIEEIRTWYYTQLSALPSSLIEPSHSDQLAA